MNDRIKPVVVRAAVYIDGFNLYFGLRSKNWQKYYWLDMYKFSEFIAKQRQLVSAKYFTADVGGRRGKVQRQQSFLNALHTCAPKLDVIKGKFLNSTITCQHCLQTFQKSEEKMTDVNIATHLLHDAWKDTFDVAIIVSGDSDLIPPIEVIKNELGKQVLVAFPPRRMSNALQQTGMLPKS